MNTANTEFLIFFPVILVHLPHISHFRKEHHHLSTCFSKKNLASLSLAFPISSPSSPINYMSISISRVLYLSSFSLSFSDFIFYKSSLSYYSLAILDICCCSVTQSCPTLCDPMDCSTTGIPVLYHLPEVVQSHVH